MTGKFVGSIAFLLLVLVLILIIWQNQTPGKNSSQSFKPPEFSKITLVPRKNGIQTPPQLTAESVLVVDLKTDSILYEKNSNLKITPASLTKLATAAVVLKQCQPDKIIQVPQIATTTPGTKMGLVSGEKITVENLLYGLLLPSGNDAATALVLGCFGNVENFLSSVAKFTQNLGMTNTQFINPQGFPVKNHYSTANDLLKLTREVLGNGYLAKIVATKEKTVTNITGTISHNLNNLNKLLDNPQILGVKTGTTAFGENLIILEQKGDNRIVSLVLQSQDRFAETEKILDWVSKNFVWESNLATF